MIEVWAVGPEPTEDEDETVSYFLLVVEHTSWFFTSQWINTSTNGNCLKRISKSDYDTASNFTSITLNNYIIAARGDWMKVKRRDGTGSVLDTNQEDRAMLDIIGKERHSEGLREPVDEDWSLGQTFRSSVNINIAYVFQPARSLTPRSFVLFFKLY